jgi:probable rRNA maturation factor
LCDDAFIQELNRTYRGRNKPTDVLSFSMKEGELLPGNNRLLGDIVISVETAARRAKDLGCTPAKEVTSLLIHGLLHLLGHDHLDSHDKKKMFSESRRLEAIFD